MCIDNGKKKSTCSVWTRFLSWTLIDLWLDNSDMGNSQAERVISVNIKKEHDAWWDALEPL